MELPAASLRQMEGHTDEVYSVAWCPTANLLASRCGLVWGELGVQRGASDSNGRAGAVVWDGARHAGPGVERSRLDLLDVAREEGWGELCCWPRQD